MNSLVLSDEQRAAATDPVIRQLIPLIPPANFFDADGTPRFVGSAPAVVNIDRSTIDLQHNAGSNDRIQAFYGAQRFTANEPGSQGNSIPGFGQLSHPRASILTINETHTFGSAILNEARFGRSVLIGGTFPARTLNPVDFGIGNGVTRSIGLPQMIVAGDLNFGGPGNLPQGRTDTSYVYNDTLTRATGRHFMRKMQHYSWPGNVRELRNVIERSVIVATGTRLVVQMPQNAVSRGFQGSLTLRNVQIEHIRATLQRTNWRVRGIDGAAERLGLKPTTLETRMAKLGLTRPLRS